MRVQAGEQVGALWPIQADCANQAQARAGQAPALRLLPGRFMVIRQAMGLLKARGAAAAAFLADYVERLKASGFVAEAL